MAKLLHHKINRMFWLMSTGSEDDWVFIEEQVATVSPSVANNDCHYLFRQCFWYLALFVFNVESIPLPSSISWGFIDDGNLLCSLNCVRFLPRKAKQSVVMPQYIVRPSVCLWCWGMFFTPVGILRKYFHGRIAIRPLLGLTPTWAIWCNGNTPSPKKN